MKNWKYLSCLFLALTLPAKAGLTSEVRLVEGVPALFVNGQPASQMAAAPYQQGTNDYNDFVRAGIQIYDIYFRFPWTAPDQYNFSRIDARLDAYLKINPKALFIGRVLLTPGEWFRAEVRSRWTGSNIYFLFIGHYQKLTLRPNPILTNETYRLWERDCFEVHLGADFEHINRYREFQISPQSEFLDLDIDSTKPRPGYNGEQKWNSGWTVKAVVDETNKIWCGEMKIPITTVDLRPPRPGNEMRINLYRQDGAGANRDFLAWQPPLVWNPHHPEKFGILRLVEADGKAPAKRE